MSDHPYSYPRGYLGWGELPPMRRERPCPRCGGDLRIRSPRELCDTCRVDPVRLAARARAISRQNRRYYLARRGGVNAPGGRP